MPSKKHDIFLSYSSKDKRRIRPIVESFEKQGWSVWWDKKIPAGKTFDKFIEENLLDSRIVVVVWSQHSVESDWVRAEAGEGRAMNNLIPLMIDEIRIPLAFKRIQTANLTSWKKEKAGENFNHFINNVWDFLWDLVKKADTKEAYEFYISKFPKGPNFNDAESRLNNFTLSASGSGLKIPKREPVKTDPQSEEEAFWKNAKEKDTIYTYRKYLKEFENGTFVGDARNRIKELKNIRESKAIIRENELWLDYKNSDDIVQIEYFIAKFPKSKCKAEALQRIQELKAVNDSRTPTNPELVFPKPPKPVKHIVKASSIHQILQKYKGKKGFHLYPNISEQQEKQIRHRLKNIPENEKILAYIIATMFGSLDNGMAFTTQRIIWQNTWGLAPEGCSRSGQILYRAFSKTAFKSGPMYSVLMSGNKGFDSSGWGDLSKHQIIAILNAIKKLFLPK